MLFSSIPFLYYFIPVVMLCYFAVPKCLKNSVLLLASLFFYAWGEPRFVVLMVISITQGYIAGLWIERFRRKEQYGRSKVILTASVLFSLGMLGYCKYADFFISNVNAVTGLSLPLLKIALPIGISFYTFQILSYVVDVYRGDVPAQRSYIDLAAYIAMFPQLIAGPIVRYTDIVTELKERTHSISGFSNGLSRFVIGLSKKILLANLLGELVSVYKASPQSSVVFAWTYAIAYTLHIYFDFSGYSDMAIGLGQMFGFHFPENFNYPYISKSITEFWRRWHMSLGSWFRDYLYIPLGGNRVAKWRWFLNLFIVWMATGLWHGAAWNFVCWGLLFAVLLIVEKVWLLTVWKKCRWMNHVYVLFFVVISFVIFDAADMTSAFGTLKTLAGFGGLPFVTEESLYYLKSYGMVMILAGIGATPFPALAIRRGRASRAGAQLLSVLEPVGLFVLLIVCTAFLIDGSFNPFLYFRF